MMIRTKSWNDLTPSQRGSVVFFGAIQLGLLVVALWDLYHRPAHRIQGTRRMWTGLVFINYFGPIAYFLFGRR